MYFSLERRNDGISMFGACKNQVPNTQKLSSKIKFKNQFREIQILKNQVQ